MDNSSLPYQESLPLEGDNGLLILKPKRSRYVQFMGDLTVRGITDWISDVLAGNGRFQKMSGPLKNSLMRSDL